VTVPGVVAKAFSGGGTNCATVALRVTALQSDFFLLMADLSISPFFQIPQREFDQKVSKYHEWR
jgi:hypothetical protein